LGIAALAGGAGLICWNGGIGVFAIDLKLGRVIKIATLSDVSFVIPYKSFYTPGIKLMPCFIYLVTTEVWIMIYVFPHAMSQSSLYYQCCYMNGGTLDSKVVMFSYLISHYQSLFGPCNCYKQMFSELPLVRQSVDAFLIQVFSAELGAPSTSDGPGAGVSNA